MSKDKKRILVTLSCRKCGRNLEFDKLVTIDPSNGSAQCVGKCGDES